MARTALCDGGPARARGSLEVGCAWAAWLLPLGLALQASSDLPGWDDVAALRDVGLQPAGSEGFLSGLLCQLALLAPVGGWELRASLVGVVALAAASGLSFGLIHRALRRESPGRYDALWALLGTQLWASGGAVAAEALQLGGSMVGLALLLLGVRVLDELPADPRRPALAGALVAVTLVEHHAAGLALLVAGAGTLAWGDRGARGRSVGEFACACAGVLAVLVGFRALRTLSPHVLVDLGVLDVSAGGVEVTTAMPSPRELLERLLEGWRERVGVAVLALALTGVAWALGRASLRRGLRGVWFLGLLGLLGALGGAAGSARAEVCWGLASAVALAALAALALRVLSVWLWTCRVPLARAVAVLGSAVAVALVLSRIDARVEAAPRPFGREVWTEEALGGLPPRTVLVVSQPVLTARLMAAQMLDGERPDVVVVPTRLSGGEPLIRRLREAHPELAPLLRQLAVSGFADEYALSQLADSRPVRVELEPKWSRRVLEQLTPRGLWLELEPHAQASFSRRAGFEETLRAFFRVVDPLRRNEALDPQTSAALAELARQQTLVLAALGDAPEAQELLSARTEWAGRDAFSRELARRLRRSRRGRVMIDDLTN